MKTWATAILCVLFLANCQTKQQNIVTSDIDLFWTAYDKIRSTQDSTLQAQYLEELYLQKGSPGLKAIREVRRYTPKDYLDAINNYPLFWESIRSNTLQAKNLGQEIENGVQQFRKIYPKLRPAKVYFTIGAFRTPGTTLDSMVLIGAELAMGDAQTEVSEFPESFNYVKNYFATNPIKDIAFLNVHEFVHTQQNDHDYIVIFRCVYEGIAEFIAVQATGKASKAPAITYGKSNDQKVKEKFKEEMFESFTMSNWLYNDLNNEFETRDMGYYVGYAIAEKFYQQATDKSKAIQTMIELDYSDEKAFNQYINQSGYFATPFEELSKTYFDSKPKVVRIKEFENGDQTVDPATTRLTFEFSEKMNPDVRGFDYGPLGEKNVLRVSNFLGFSEDGKSASIEVELQPNQRYQMVLSHRFRSAAGFPLQAYLIDIKTSN